MAVYCLYHSPCADGMSAAYAVWRLYFEKAIYIPLNYGQKLPELEPNSRVIFVDITVKKPILRDLAKQHSEILIIDHHVSAKEDLDGIEGDPEFSNVLAIFDMTRAASMMAWGFFHPDVRPPLFFNYVQDYDLWKFEIPHSKAVNEVIYSYPQTLNQWDSLAKQSVSLMIGEGEAIMRYQEKHVSYICADPRMAYIGGHLIPTVNVPPAFKNDCCHHLLQKFPEAPFSAAYHDVGNGDRHWSLRGRETGISVKEVAEQYAGGGHRNAAGFRSRANEDSPAFSVIQDG